MKGLDFSYLYFGCVAPVQQFIPCLLNPHWSDGRPVPGSSGRYTPSLSVTGTLDLTSNDLDLQASGPIGLASVTSLIKQAFSNGSWTGTGITSTTASGDTAHLTAVGVILNSNFTSFDGSPVALNDVLARETYYGDADLNGKVDGSD